MRRVLLVATLILGVLPGIAGAANRRVAISDYRWSDPNLQVNLGEHVSWYWTGPDTMHSITGNSPESAGLDSDPQTNLPNHKIGDSYQISFNKPGVYQFQCKLHSSVKGTVTVSATPGDPVSEPDPVPRSNVDLTPPRLRQVKLGARSFGRRGTSLRFSLGESAKLVADLYRYDGRGRRHFAGYRSWRGHVGFNGVRIGARSRHFRPRPGSYLAILRAVDAAANTAAPQRVRFRIRRR